MGEECKVGERGRERVGERRTVGVGWKDGGEKGEVKLKKGR